MARMCNDGSIIGSSKSFEEMHPTRPGKRILYASIEGPEAAMCLRGSARVGGKPAVIELPEHFTVLAAEGTVTASVTAVGRCAGGLHVRERGIRRIVVERDDASDGASCEFDWLVMSARSRLRDWEPVRDVEE